MLINDEISAAQACLVEVKCTDLDRASSRCRRNDTGHRGPSGLGTTTDQRQCVIDASTILVTPQGTSVYIDLPLSFLSGFNGLKNVYALATAGGFASGWRLLGTGGFPRLLLCRRFLR